MRRGIAANFAGRKVDRLTRSLADFAKIVEIFDARGVSFVSVTQQFNTTSSMGRLTLNVLLSFAQFEREVTGERIRDKIAASKKKGMWMGGLPPLGYDVNDRKLIVNEIEAQTVRHIFERYIELGSVRQLKMELDAEGIVSKLRNRQDGTVVGGTSFFRGALYGMLQNRLYLGEVVHKNQCYPGEHAAIIDRDIWDRAQLILNRNRVDRNINITAQSPSLLAGLLHDETGERMTPSHAVKPRGGEGPQSDGQEKSCKRYRYYISQSLVTKTKEATPQVRRVPAADIEGIVTQRIWVLLADRRQLFNAIEPLIPDAVNQQHLLTQAAQLSRTWLDLSSADMRKHLLAMVAKIVTGPCIEQSVSGILLTAPSGFGIQPTGSRARMTIKVSINRTATRRLLLMDIPIMAAMNKDNQEWLQKIQQPMVFFDYQL